MLSDLVRQSKVNGQSSATKCHPMASPRWSIRPDHIGDGSSQVAVDLSGTSPCRTSLAYCSLANVCQCHSTRESPVGQLEGLTNWTTGPAMFRLMCPLSGLKRLLGQTGWLPARPAAAAVVEWVWRPALAHSEPLCLGDSGNVSAANDWCKFLAFHYFSDYYLHCSVNLSKYVSMFAFAANETSAREHVLMSAPRRAITVAGWDEVELASRQQRTIDHSASVPLCPPTKSARLAAVQTSESTSGPLARSINLPVPLSASMGTWTISPIWTFLTPLAFAPLSWLCFIVSLFVGGKLSSLIWSHLKWLQIFKEFIQSNDLVPKPNGFVLTNWQRVWPPRSFQEACPNFWWRSPN